MQEQEHHTKYAGTVCRGSVMLGSGCRTCEKCKQERVALLAACKPVEQEDHTTHVNAGEPHQGARAALVTDLLLADLED